MQQIEYKKIEIIKYLIIFSGAISDLVKNYNYLTPTISSKLLLHVDI
jgi:hypothetical protein